MAPRRRFVSILITGASNGIGAALAREYAAPGVALCLTGRDQLRLSDVANACRAAGAMVRTAALDVTDDSAMAAQLADWDDSIPFDLVIANAGIGPIGETPPGGGWREPLRAITATNVGGTINTIEPLLPRMLARASGQIALMSSLAGFIGLPPAPGYGASKAWMRIYGEAMRGAVAAQGIGVSVVCPGFVATPMIAQTRFLMPFLMSAERAARLIAKGLAANRGRIAFPWPMVATTWFVSALPAVWGARVVMALSRVRRGATAAR